MSSRFLWDGLRRLRSRVEARRRVEPAAPQMPPLPDPARIALITPLMDTEYYWSQAAAVIGSLPAEDAAVHYLSQGAALGLPPNPAFDDAFYRAQLPNPLPAGTTPLEHYLERGADAGLDPSPLFSTRGYLRVHTDVASAKVNPLWHFLRWGAGEGRQPLPDDLPDREARIAQVLTRDPNNVPALRMLGEIRLRQHRPDEALDALERAERGGSLDATGRMFKGEALLRLGAIDQAVPILTQALVEAPAMRDALPVDLLYAAGQRDLATAILSAAISAQDGSRTVIEALERRIAHVESQCSLERDRVDWALAMHEGLPEQIAAYQAVRNERAYWAAYDASAPLVSIVVATADRTATLLERSIPSALAQTHHNLQIVVVGDCAPAATERGLAAFQDSRIHFFNRAERGPYPAPGRDRWRVGGCLAMNEGLARSTGDFITHLDDDDTMEPHRIEAMLTAARQERADFLWHGLRFQLPDGSWMELGNGLLEVGQVGTASIFYHRYFARIPWDLQAYRASEPGDWNRLRKIKALRPRLHYVAEVLASHFVDPSPQPFRPLQGERFLDD